MELGNILEHWIEKYDENQTMEVMRSHFDMARVTKISPDIDNLMKTLSQANLPESILKHLLEFYNYFLAQQIEETNEIYLSSSDVGFDYCGFISDISRNEIEKFGDNEVVGVTVKDGKCAENVFWKELRCGEVMSFGDEGCDYYIKSNFRMELKNCKGLIYVNTRPGLLIDAICVKVEEGLRLIINSVHYSFSFIGDQVKVKCLDKQKEYVISQTYNIGTLSNDSENSINILRFNKNWVVKSKDHTKFWIDTASLRNPHSLVVSGSKVKFQEIEYLVLYEW